MFYATSSFKDGEDAGKLDMVQFEEVLKKSRQFKLGKMKAAEYFRMLDIDGDNHISFSEFIAPLLESIPPRVAIAFVSDVRFKMECYTNLRHAYRMASSISSVVTKQLIKGKLHDRRDPLSRHFVQALEELNLPETIEEKDFLREVARQERQCLISFANLTFA